MVEPLDGATATKLAAGRPGLHLVDAAGTRAPSKKTGGEVGWPDGEAGVVVERAGRSAGLEVVETTDIYLEVLTWELDDVVSPEGHGL